MPDADMEMAANAIMGAASARGGTLHGALGGAGGG
jgi:hypothetical protein